MKVARSGDRRVVRRSRVEESGPVGIREFRIHGAGQVQRDLQPSSFQGGAIEGQEAVDDERIILEVSGDTGVTIIPTPDQSSLLLHLIHDKVCVSFRYLEKVAAAKYPGSVRERFEHQAIPRSNPLAVQP